MTTPARNAGSIRIRVRAELVEEIKATARRHLAAEGANLSLRAVARDLGLVSSALYRYFASRDELLTALIIDAYHAIGQVAEDADAAVAPTDRTGRWIAVTRAIRGWALAHPHEYALIYGSPVPGYAAPVDTVAPATRTTAVLAGLLRDAVAAGAPIALSRGRMPRTVRADLHRLAADPRFAGIPEPAFARGMALWTQLFGTISFELFGQFNNVITDRDAFFDYQMRAAATQAGLDR
jgi:AcrR family transcriptional regulator